MNDFPWSWWVHGGNTACKGTMRMADAENDGGMENYRKNQLLSIT